MRIFVTGCRGQLGRDVMETLSERHTTAGLDLPELDIADPEAVRRRLAPFAPEAIVNCAAYTRVDDAERDPAAAERVNAAGVAVLAAYAAAAPCRLIHISTDYVFDGAREPPQPYLESDAPAPLSVYGRTKLAGERAVAASGARAAVLRTAWLYGRHGANFLKTILRRTLAAPDRPLRVVNDQYGSPTWSWRLARQIAAVLEAGAEGLFHATAEGACTWFELARRFLEEMGLPQRLRPCASAEYPTAARRPRNSILENARLKAAGLNVMVAWDADLREYVRRYREALLAEACERT